MNESKAPTVILLMAAFLGATAASAHHSHSNIDRSNIQLHTGVVNVYGWTMPHVFLKVMAPNQQGEVVEYSIELLHPPGMLRRGWDADTFKPGDRITWEGASDRDPSRYYSGLTWVEKSDGTRLTTVEQEVAVQPSTDFTGLWKRDLRGGKPHYFPPAAWPYTARGQALVDNFDESQNPQVECKNAGPPKATLLPYPIQISRPDDKTIIMHGELRPEPRVVYLDRSHPPAEPSQLGHSVGWFEGEELVVETTNFTADRWGTHTGIDSSDEKHLLERYSLSNGGLALDVLMTVTDPVYLNEPVVIDYHLAKIPDRELIEAPCTYESAALFLEGGY